MVSMLKWVRLRQAFRAEVRTSVVQNRTRRANNFSYGMRCPWFVRMEVSGALEAPKSPPHLSEDEALFDGLDTGVRKRAARVRDCTMIDWDDVRYFLAVARGGSVRAAAERLGVNHSTVLRRIAQLEERLGAQMFEKLPSGYRLTNAGEEVLQFAEQMEASSNRLETRVFGRDQGVSGLLRVTLAPTLATHLLMPDFADFGRLHPEIEMEILSIGEPVNLTNREADVAIRVVYDRNALPLNLHGLKGPELFGGVYMSRDLLAAWHAGAPERIRWIVISKHGIPDWAREGEVRTTEIPFRTTDAEAQIVAVRQGLGMTTLPCFVGDADPSLVRVPGTPLHKHGTLWLLTHGETRKTKRVRLFTEFVSRKLASYAPLLAGLASSRD
jgi:DNA-binding transcriptional LysR family regulator